MRSTPPLQVDGEDAATLRGWVDSGPAGSAAVRRARIVLGSAAGIGATDLAAALGCSPQTVLTWRERYRTDGIAGLRDAPRPGRPVTVEPAAVVERTLYAPPPQLRARRWSSRLLAAELGISNVAVAKVWRSWGISPLDDGRVRLATEPPLDRPLAAVAGVHLDAATGVLALVVADRPGHRPPRERPRLGARFDMLDLGGSTDSAGLADLLARLDDLPGERLRLLVDRAPAAVDRWAAARGAVVHTVPPDLAWTRFVRVAAVVSGATDHGAASVSGLRDAVVEHLPGRPLRWVAPPHLAASLGQ